jgi:hypothetical protein
LLAIERDASRVGRMPSPQKKPATSAKPAMSASHKAALAKGRHQSRIVRAYLNAIENAKPRRSRARDPQTITNRIGTIDLTLASADPVTRVKLIQERLDLTAELAAQSGPEELDGLEAEFVEVAQAFGQAKGITYPAWREVGVPAAVLARAGITRSS